MKKFNQSSKAKKAKGNVLVEYLLLVALVSGFAADGLSDFGQGMSMAYTDLVPSVINNAENFAILTNHAWTDGHLNPYIEPRENLGDLTSTVGPTVGAHNLFSTGINNGAADAFYYSND